MRYEDDFMNWTYTGALAYYRKTPPYAELVSWTPGDRLHDPPRRPRPHKVVDRDPSS